MSDQPPATPGSAPGGAGGWGAPPGPPDPKRWIALVILSSTLFIIVLDNTILNVAVPTIIRQFHTQVSSMQWVISGYSLVFASQVSQRRDGGTSASPVEDARSRLV